MKEQVIVAFLAGGCIVLTAVSGLVYLKQDRTPPQIVVDTKEEVSYKDGDSYEALFKGVTAKDNRDGDLTDQIFIDRIISLNEKKAVVYYGVTDKANNVGTAKRKITYSEADSSDTEEADETGVEASETPVTSKNTDGVSPILTLATQSKNIQTGSEFDPTSMVDGQPWRCLHYVPDSVCYQMVERPEQFYQSALSFGHFLKQLGDYPAESLYETIPKFHDTVKRFHDFKDALRKDVKNRARLCREEIEFVLAREDDCGVLMKQLEEGILPLRVTHNDTKLNNILFDKNTGEGLCIIDLDTIMPGLAANDFGDSIRFGASTAEEDEKDLNKVHFDIELYRIYVKGYLEMAKDVLTPAENASLPWGARLMTLECGMRFLADFLQGDVYFKTTYPEHNLVRARTQFRLVKEMEEQFDQMQEIVETF